MNYYNEIKENLLKSEIYDRVKDYSKDRNKVNIYFQTGRLLSKAGKKYGNNIIKRYSEKLMTEIGKKYNERNLRYMRKFYEIFSNGIWNMSCSKLCWSHYREVLSLKDMNVIRYYLDECESKSLTIKQLQTMIKNNAYNRLSDKTKNKIINKQQLKISDTVPNPIIIRKSLLDEKLTEYSLKQSILNSLDDFLLELGNGFTYVGNEYKIKVGNSYNYIDLLLFNIEYNCYVVIELKVTELKKEHIGQIQVYMNYVDQNIRKFNQNKTIGVIICKQDNKYVIKYCSDERIISREYMFI